MEGGGEIPKKKEGKKGRGKIETEMEDNFLGKKEKLAKTPAPRFTTKITRRP